MSSLVSAIIPIRVHPDKSHFGARGGIRGEHKIERNNLFEW